MPATLAAAGAAEEQRKCARDEQATERGCVRNPRLVHRVEPIYPSLARKQRVVGSVTLNCTVTEKGDVQNIAVASSQASDSNFIPNFEEAAKSAVAEWRYRPATLDGKPMSFDFSVNIDFKLSP